MRKLISILYILGITINLQAVTPSLYESCNINEGIKKKTIIMVEESSLDLYWTFTNNAAPLNLSGVGEVDFVYSPRDKTWVQVITGSVFNATNGQVKIPFTPQTTATNGIFEFDIVLSSNGVIIVKQAKGNLILLAKAGDTTNTFPTTTNVVDLTGYTFLNYPWLTEVSLTGAVDSVSVSGGILTKTGTKDVIIALTTNAVRNATKQEVNANGLTGTVANARLDLDLQKLANNDGSSLTNFNEADPIWVAVSNTVRTQAANGQTAYGWGNHATNGYLKSESDTLNSVVARGNSTTRTIYPGSVVSSQDGKFVVRSKDNNGSSLWLQGGLDGTESWIQIGKNDLYGGFGPRTGIVAIAQSTESGGIAPIVLGCSKLGVGDGSVTNILMDSDSGKVNAKGGYQWNGTNLVNWRQGSIGGTASVYFVINGTNYHIRVK